MPDSALRDLPAALDLAVFEQVSGTVFKPVGRLPSWLNLSDPTGETDLADQFPMLEFFFPDFAPAWVESESQPGGFPVTSDIWTEYDPQGTELYVQAVATTVGGRHFLILKTLPKERHTYQQLAHDFELAEERAERNRLIAERATQAKSDFLATMSHEIRTPLNAVIGMADVLSATPLTPDQRRCVEVSQRNGVGLLTLINDILDLSKVESGHVELESTGMDLREVIDRARDVVEQRATAKGLALGKTLAPAVPVYLTGDPNRLRQVMINLLGNSIKFTEKGSLHVTVAQDPEDDGPGCLRFAISDTGIGIPEDKLAAVFESFTQADSSTTRKYGGTGLGLTISKQLVELMGGRIWVESTVGVGSTFFFTVKLAVQEDQTERSTSIVAPANQLATGMKILMADDSEDNRFLIVSYLNTVGAAIDIAENGEIAVRMFRANKYDVVLMDAEMPVMDGFTATRNIRQFEKETGAAPTPVLALTAHAFVDASEKAFAAGFTELLTKPIRKAVLLEALAKYKPILNKVVVEEGMEAVVPGYLAKRRAEIPVYQQALAEGNFETIRGLGHKMKGTGSGYGFPVLTELGSALEKAAERSDVAEIQAKIEELTGYLNSVELEFTKRKPGTLEGRLGTCGPIVARSSRAQPGSISYNGGNGFCFCAFGEPGDPSQHRDNRPSATAATRPASKPSPTPVNASSSTAAPAPVRWAAI